MNRFALVLIALLPMCLAPSQLVAAADGPVHIVVLGSSTAAGTGPSHPDSAWVNRYRNALQALDPANQVTNLAVGGYTTYHIRPTGTVPPAGRPKPDTLHNITRALSLDPDAIIINLPSNDAAYGYSVAEQLESYDLVLAAADLAGVPVWVSTTQPRNLTPAGRDNLMAMRDSTYARFGDKAVDFWTDIANPDGTINPLYNSGDGIHLNDAGHRILFQRVMAKDIPQAVTTAVFDEPRPRGSGLRLEACRPNPLCNNSVIRYVLDRRARVRLEVYDIVGRRIAMLQDEEKEAGTHAFAWNAGTFPSGTYILTLRDAGARAARRVTIVR